MQIKVFHSFCWPLLILSVHLDSFWNHVTSNLTTNEVIASIAKVAFEATAVESVSDFITGMADDNIYYAAVGSWKYIVSRAVTDTPTFFVNNIRVDADFTWTVDDWKWVLDPLFGKNSKLKPNCQTERRHTVYSNNETCPDGEIVCDYLPGKYMCCLPGEACIKNTGCRCAHDGCAPRKISAVPIYTTQLAQCPAGLTECDYLPGKSMCCTAGEQCVPNLGCRCAKEVAPQCDRDRQPIVYSTNQTCPTGEQVCNYSPDQYMCCLSGEKCIPNVGCRCASKRSGHKKCEPRRPSSTPLYTSKLAACPAGLKECDYLPGKYMCCTPGEQCVPNVGCVCAEDRIPNLRCAGSRGNEQLFVLGNATCTPPQTACNYAPGKSTCCYPGDFCIPNVGCTCTGSADCKSRSSRVSFVSKPNAKICPVGDVFCKIGPASGVCCSPSEKCIHGTGCRCLSK